MIDRIKRNKLISILFIILFIIALSWWSDSLVWFIFFCLFIRWLIWVWKKIFWNNSKKIKSRTVIEWNDGLIKVEMIEYENEYIPLPPIQDQRTSICPYCAKELKKIPWRKTKCPHCQKDMYVRTWIDRIKKVVTEKEANEIDMLKIAEPYMQDGSFQKEQARLRKQFWWEPRTADILWWLYNQDRMKHAVEWNWWLYRNTTHQMAEQLERENKLKWALKLYSHVVFYDINWANNWWWYWPMFDRSQAFLASQVWSILDISKKLNMNTEELKEFFIKESESIYNKHMPVKPLEWWYELEKEFENYK